MKKNAILIIALLIIIFDINAWSNNSIKDESNSISNNLNTNAYNLNELAIRQMNYHLISMSQIIQDKSLDCLDYELSQLLNNLTIEHIINLSEIKYFREQLMNTIQDLQITAEEKLILQRIKDIKEDNLIWQSLSSALNPTLILTQSKDAYQLAFNTLLTVARGAVNYQTSKNELRIEEIQNSWQLKKEDLQKIKTMRSHAFDATYSLYKRFNLKETDRLVEEDALLYVDIINEKNSETRLNHLNDYAHKFSHLLDYQYHLGMAYLETFGYKEAKQHLNKYLIEYNKTPIFRNDNKSAFVYLTQLAYEQMTADKADKTIKNIINIIPNNGAATIQCALKYLELGQKQKAYELIRKGIDNPNITHKKSILTLAINLAPQIKQMPSIWQSIQKSIFNNDNLDFDSYVAFLSNCSNSILKEKIEDLLKIKDATSHKYFLWGENELTDSYTIEINKKYNTDLKTISIYFENTTKKAIEVSQCKLSFSNNIYKKENLIKNLPEVKDNPIMLYTFFSPIDTNMHFKLKPNLNSNKEIEEYPNWENVSGDSKKIIQKLIKRDGNKQYYSLDCNQIDIPIPIPILGELLGVTSVDKILSDYKIVFRPNFVLKKTMTSDIGKILFKGNSLNYIPLPIYNIEKTCIRIVLNGDFPSIITYVYDKNSDMVIPFSIATNKEIRYLIDTTGLEKIDIPKTAIEAPSDKKEKTQKKEDNLINKVWNKIF